MTEEPLGRAPGYLSVTLYTFQCLCSGHVGLPFRRSLSPIPLESLGTCCSLCLKHYAPPARLPHLVSSSHTYVLKEVFPTVLTRSYSSVLLSQNIIYLIFTKLTTIAVFSISIIICLLAVSLPH